MGVTRYAGLVPLQWANSQQHSMYVLTAEEAQKLAVELFFASFGYYPLKGS